MSDRKTAAQFTAYIWYLECAEGKASSRAEAGRFAAANWRYFIQKANRGLGRLLSRIARPRKASARRAQAAT